MDIYTFRTKIERHMKKMIEDVKEIKKITSVEEQYGKISFNLRIHKRDFKDLKQNKPKDYHDHYWSYNLDKYEKEIKKLEELEKELLQKSIQLKKIENSSCNKCKEKITTDNCYVYLWNKGKIKKWTIDEVAKFSFEDFERHVPIFCSEICFKKSYWSSKPKKNKTNLPKKQVPNQNNICWECHKTNSEKWFINQESGLEFCSQACNLEHNAELCENCVQKCLKYENGVAVDYQTYYKDNETKTGTLCSDCKQKQRKELTKKLKRLEEEQSEDKEELENNNGDDYNKKDISSKDNNPTSNNTIRERERERESKSNLIWTNYFHKSLI